MLPQANINPATPMGATLVAGGATFRAWAPRAQQVYVNGSCLIRHGHAYPWHDQDFVTPDYSEMVVYQLHVGTFAPASPEATGTFLDVIEKVEYLSALGVNVIQCLPADEVETYPSMGYNGADYFSPDLPYVVRKPAALSHSVATINCLLAARGCAPLNVADIVSGPHQAKAFIDLCHLCGMAVVFDVVYNHAGGFEGDDQSLYFWDRATNGDNNQSLYLTDRGWAGGLAFALWNRDVRQFLINSAHFYVDEFHVDGYVRGRYRSVLTRLGSGRLTGSQEHKRERVSNMDIQSKQPTVKGPSETFRGDVWFDVIAKGEDYSRMRVNTVRFAPCARTAWHSHPGGQTLYVTEGIGLVQARGGEVIEIRAGDVIYTPPREEHWHGATPDHFMTHVAMWEVDDQGNSATWGVHVSDKEYGAQPRRSSGEEA